MTKVHLALGAWTLIFLVSLAVDRTTAPLLVLGLTLPALGFMWTRINARFSAADKRANQLAAQVQTLSKALEQQTRELKAAQKPPYETFSRTLSDDDIHQLESHWMPALELQDVNARQLKYLSHHIGQEENLSVGRLAGDVQDAVLRVLVAFAVKDKDLSLLEIGTLFGVNAAATYNLAQGRFERVTMTLIDPLDGYYQSGADRNTGMPIDERIVRHNLAKSGVKDEDLTLIKAYSSDEAAVQRASASTFNYAFIDGDHTFEGIQKDVVLYGPMIRPGGFMILDNYGDETWPDVARFVDEEMMKDEAYAYLGRFGRTVIFQKKSKA